MMRQWKRIRISEELLLEALKMPAETRIVRIGMAQVYNAVGGTIEMIVEHPDFQEHVAGEEIELINPTYETIRFDWGLKDAMP